MSALVEVRDLTIAYDSIDRSVLALDGAELTIEAGESLAIVGESGSGKSTLGMAIGRLLPPEARHLNGDLMFRHDLGAVFAGEEVFLVSGQPGVVHHQLADGDRVLRIGRKRDALFVEC